MSEGERSYRVIGMTCEHCVAAVRGEVAGLAGVDTVEVDLAGGELLVCGNVADEAVRSAVEAAGYSVSARGGVHGDQLTGTANEPLRLWPIPSLPAT